MIEIDYEPHTAPIARATVRCKEDPDADYLEVRPDYHYHAVAIQPTSSGTIRNTVYVPVEDIDELISVLRRVQDQVS